MPSPADSLRNVDRIIARVHAHKPQVEVWQLEVKHPGDDDGLWFFSLPQHEIQVQIESPDGQCPFLVENTGNDERLTCDSISTTVDAIVRLLEEDTR